MDNKSDREAFQAPADNQARSHTRTGHKNYCATLPTLLLHSKKLGTLEIHNIKQADALVLPQGALTKKPCYARRSGEVIFTK